MNLLLLFWQWSHSNPIIGGVVSSELFIDMRPSTHFIDALPSDQDVYCQPSTINIPVIQWTT